MDNLPDLGDAFEIREPLGSGAMGAVYRAHDRRLARDVALKVMSSEISHNPEVRARFLREARALALCKHPNIIQVHACSSEEAEVPYGYGFWSPFNHVEKRDSKVVLFADHAPAHNR